MSIIPRSLIRFEQDLRSTSDPHASIKNGVIGGDIEIDGPLGPKRMVYADYVASGRALRQVEDFVMTEVLPYYANSHTEQSLCGATMTQLREGARALEHVRGNPNIAQVKLGAQIFVIGFYERLGFEAHGPEFDDAGIPHRMMTLDLVRSE